ncbi:MAG: hypothetical protein OEW05_09050 [Candidatus Aminicenantes bacterium]|nr:hypothetical protein [Candidatus Aminicenantes bacterium]
MRRTTLTAILLLLVALGRPALAQGRADDTLFQEAKLLIFDKSWSEAQNKLEELMGRFPQSALFGQALFYKAECLSQQKGKAWEALNAYQAYLQYPQRNASFAEDAEVAIIDLALRLYEEGNRPLLREIESRLDHPSKYVRYSAAIKLSFVTDKRVAARASPVLQRILETETDSELLDRARIALLRVDPDALRGVEGRKSGDRNAWTLRIRIMKKGKREPTLSLDLPWALADLILSAIPEKERQALRSKGYDLDKIIDHLSRRNLLRIEDEEGSIELSIIK